MRHGKQVTAGGVEGNHAFIVTAVRKLVFIDMRQQGLRGEGLEEEVASAGAHGIDCLVDFSVGGHQHDGQVGQTRPDCLEQLDAIHRHHADIADDDGESLLRQDAQRRLAPVDEHMGPPGQSQGVANRFTQIRVILDDQDGQTVFSHGLRFLLPPGAGS